MCLAPHVPPPPPPPPPPPDPPEKTALKVAGDPAQQAAQDLASRLGTSQLLIPLTHSLNIPG